MKSLVQANADTKKPESDWLLDDPFGLDLDEDIDNLVEEVEEISIEEIKPDVAVMSHSISPNTSTTTVHPQIVITEAKVHLQGPRQLILDTETYRFLFPRW